MCVKIFKNVFQGKGVKNAVSCLTVLKQNKIFSQLLKNYEQTATDRQ